MGNRVAHLKLVTVAAIHHFVGNPWATESGEVVIAAIG